MIRWARNNRVRAYWTLVATFCAIGASLWLTAVPVAFIIGTVMLIALSMLLAAAVMIEFV